MFIPQKMKEKKQWIICSGEKTPVLKKGESWNNHDKWLDFDTAIKTKKKNQYLGFIFNNDFIGIDLDLAFDENNNLFQWAEHVLSNIEKDTAFIEYSVSKKGLHIFLEIKEEKFKKIKGKKVKFNDEKAGPIEERFSFLPSKCAIEMYTNGRYFLVTGDVYDNNDKISYDKKTNDKFFELYKWMENLLNSKNKRIKQKSNKLPTEDDIFSKINQSLFVGDVISKYWQDIKDKGNLCPFHGDKKTPSLKINYIKNYWHCFGCEAGGDGVRFVSLLKKITDIEAAKLLNKDFNLGIDFKKLENKMPYYYTIVGKDKNTGVIKYKINNGLLAKYIDEKEHLIKEKDQLYYYTEGNYTELSKQDIFSMIDEYVMDSLKSIYIRNEVKATLLSSQGNKMIDIRKPTNSVNVKNGIICFKDNKPVLEKHTPKVFYKNQIPVNYNREARCLKFEKFLDDVLPEDQQKLLQEWFGYLLIEKNCIKKFFILVGEGNTGKSVIFEILTKLISDKNISTISLHNLCDSKDKFQTYYLKDSLVNIVADLPEIILEDLGVVKQITGRDIINAQKKGSPERFDFRPNTRLFFSCNKIPDVKVKDNAFFNRMVIIPFTNVIKEEKQINNIKDTFDYEGILSWAIIGLQRLILNNYCLSLTREQYEQKKKYKKENSNVLQFVEDECVLDCSEECTTEQLYNNYKEYCTSNGYMAKRLENLQ